MSRILYILAVNYDRKHLKNFKIGLENSWIFFLFQKSWNPVLCISIFFSFMFCSWLIDRVTMFYAPLDTN